MYVFVLTYFLRDYLLYDHTLLYFHTFMCLHAFCHSANDDDYYLFVKNLMVSN